MSKTVAVFAHRFLDCRHKLTKLIAEIHVTQENDEIELREAFLIKLRPAIKKNELVRWEFSVKKFTRNN